MKSNLNATDGTERAPPLDLREGKEVLVVNADRSNLSWKRYKLLVINEVKGTCIVEGIGNDSRQRNFPRSVVKPKDWIDKLKALFRAIAGYEDEEQNNKQSKPKKSKKTRHVELHNFLNAMKLFGAEYDLESALKIFKALDLDANGILSFREFINWVYGLGRIQDKGRLLTTIECVAGIRRWSNTYTYYVMATENDENTEGSKCIWSSAKYDKENSNADTVHLVTMSAKNLNLGKTGLSKDVSDESIEMEEPNIFQIPKNLSSFSNRLSMIGLPSQMDEVYSPSNIHDASHCAIVVMGPGEIGKTALINKFVKGSFPHDYDPTIQDHCRKPISVDGDTALLDILDTAGQDEFGSMRYDWLKNNIDVLLICFSRADHASFVQAKQLIDIAKRLLRQKKDPRAVPILLVATKQDVTEQRVEVTQDDVDELQADYGGEDFVGYVECSAFMDTNIELVFEKAVKMYRKWRNTKSGRKVRTPTEATLRKDPRLQERRVSYAQQMNNASNAGRTKCVSCLAKFCPAMAAYMESDDGSNKAFAELNIASVPKDKFGDELAEPSYSKQHFFVAREFSLRRFIYAIIAAAFFPVVITFQTCYFVFYCEGTNCCFKLFDATKDYDDPQDAFLYDFFGPIVGRDPRDSAKSNDARKWFLSQTVGQKFARLLITAFVDLLFVAAWSNAITQGFAYFEDADVEELEVDVGELSLIETLGPGQLWIVMWIILSVYVSLDIDVKPEPPSMQALRPYVMYLNADESIRTTAYVFLRGFAKSTLAIFRLEATTQRIATALFVSIVWILIPGVIRVVFQADGGGLFFPKDLELNAISSMFVSFFFVFFIVLGLQMQLMSGLVKYIDWMNDITSMLDEVFSEEKKLHYVNLTRHNNTLAWLEMRTYLYTKGLIIFSGQEIFVLYVLLLQVAMAIYLLARLMSGSFDIDNTYGSPSFVGIFFVFLALTYSLLRILRTTRRIERLQGKQIALLAAQKFQIYYKRITWHSDKDQNDEQSQEGGDALDSDMETNHFDQDFFDIDPENLPPMDDEVVEEESGSNSNSDNDDEAISINEEQKEKETDYVSLAAGSPRKMDKKLGRAPTKLRLQRTATVYNGPMENEAVMFSAEYLEQSEKFVQATINICEAQDIIPRIFNMKVHVAVGLSILCTSFAVLPTAMRLAFGNDCQEWSN